MVWIIVGFFVLVFAVVAGVAEGCKGEPACRDTVRVISAIQIFRAPELTCPSKDHVMTVERQIQGAVVTCTCRK